MTERCDALNFKLRKSHKKVLKKFNKFLLTGEKPSKRRETELRNDFDTDMSEEQKTAKPLMDEMNINRECTQDINPINEFDVIPDNSLNVKSNERKTVSETSVHKKTKAKTLRIERKLKKIMEREKCDEIKAKDIMSIEFLNRTKNRIKIKTLEEYLTENENHSDRAHKLEVKLEIN
jgi:arginine-tRNA-protein transferase